MVTGQTYEETKAIFAHTPTRSEPPDYVTSGLSIVDQYWFFRQAGFYQMIDYVAWHAKKQPDGQYLTNPNDVWPPEPFAPVHVAQVTQAATGNAHSVVLLNNGDVLDPLRAGIYRLTDPAWSELSHVIGLYKP